MEVDEVAVVKSDDGNNSDDLDWGLDDVDESDIYENDNVILDKFLDGKITFDQCLSQMKDLSGNAENDGFVDQYANYLIDGSDVIVGEDTTVNATTIEHVEEEKVIKPRRRAGALDPALQSMIGHANIRLLRGDMEKAMQDFRSVFREKPQSAEPYRLIAQAYENIGDHEKALQLNFIATYLGPSTVAQWMSLYKRYKQRGAYQQAVACISRAIYLDDTNVSYYMQRAALLTHIGQEKLAMQGFLRLIRKLPPVESAKIAYLCMITGEYFYKNQRYADAGKILSYLAQRFPAQMSDETARLYANVLFELKDFKKCLKFICDYYNAMLLETTKCEEEEEQEEYSQYAVSVCDLDGYDDTDRIDADMLAKLIVCLIQVEAAYEITDRYVDELTRRYYNDRSLSRNSSSSSSTNDCIFQVASTYMIKNEFARALRLLSKLETDETFKVKAELWTNLNLCYENIGGHVEKSLEMLREAIRTCPQSVEHRLALCASLKTLRRYEEALTVLQPNTDRHVRDPSVLYEACTLYDCLGRQDEFLECSYRLFVHSFACGRVIRTAKELNMVYHIIRKERHLKSYDWQNSFDDIDRDNGTTTTTTKTSIIGSSDNSGGVVVVTSISAEKEWSIFLKAARILSERKQFDLLQRLAFSMFLSSKLTQAKQKDVKLAAIISCLYCRDYSRGFDMLCMFFISRKIRTARIWNLFNLFVTKAGSSRVNKFLVRIIEKDADNLGASTLYANYCLRSGTYRFALNDYLALYTKLKDPLIALQLAVVLVHIAAQRHSTSKISLVVQIMYFLKEYERLRGPEEMQQEIYYNIGRAYHQLGRLSDAEMFYKKSLEAPTPTDLPHFDLRPEVAFNLSLIYKINGCDDLANYYLDKYIVT